MKTTRTLLIPEYDPTNPKPYPGDIKPGHYNGAELEQLLQAHQNNPEAMRFLKEMMEE